MSNIAPFETIEALLEQLRVDAKGEAKEFGHPVEEHPCWIAADEIEQTTRQRDYLRGVVLALSDRWLSSDQLQKHVEAATLTTKDSNP